jgi:hypothetical protein
MPAIGIQFKVELTMRIAGLCVMLLVFSQCSILHNEEDKREGYEDEDFELLQLQKERSQLPGSVQDATVNQIVMWSGLRTMPAAGLPRERWSVKDRDYVYGEEHHSVRVTCYLLEAKQQPDGDYHLYLAAGADSAKKSGFIAEMTPGFLHQGKWSIDSIRKYQGQQIRVTGWLLWDDQHDQGGDRATSWEIHPVTQFEVMDSVGWHPI